MPLIHECTRLDRVMNAVAAGTSDQNSSSVDMSVNGGYRGVRWIALFGGLTAGQVTKCFLQGSDDDSSWSDLAGTETTAMADGDSNKIVVIDQYRPVHRYNRLVIDRGTANAVIDGVLAELYEPITEPTAHADISQAEMHISPKAGTK